MFTSATGGHFCYSFLDDDNFQAILTLCEEFKIEWLKKSCEDFLQSRKHGSFSTLQYSIYFSLAEKYHLNDLKISLTASFLDSFSMDKREDFLMIAERYLSRKEIFLIEKKIETSNNIKYFFNQVTSILPLLKLANKHHLYDLRKKLLTKSYYREILTKEDFGKLNKATSFEVIRKVLKNEIKNDESRFLILELIGEVFEQFSKILKVRPFQKTIINKEKQDLVIANKKEVVDNEIVNIDKEPQNTGNKVKDAADEAETKAEKEDEDESVILVSTIPDPDVEIEVGNRIVKLHSVILCQSSPVFKIMLQSDHFNEGRSKKVHLGTQRDVDATIEFFRMLYPSMRAEFQSEFF